MAVDLVTVTGNLETLAGTAPLLGRVWFRISRADWTLSGEIFAPEYVEVIADAVTGAFSVDLQSTDDFEAGSTYAAVLKYREPLDAKDREFTIGTFALPSGGPYQLGDLMSVPVAAPVPADVLALCQAYAAATAADSVQTGLDRTAAAADVALTHADVSLADAARIASEAARDAAIAGSILTWPTTAAGIGPGIAGVTSIVAGSGGANGTFPLAYSGGTQALAPVGVFTVAGGALVSVTITYPGYYSAGTPTLSFAASAGLTGASATAVMAANTPVNGFFAVPSAVTGEAAIIYKNVAGVATEVMRTPSASAVLRPSWTDKRSGWLDPFFRRTVPGQSPFAGRDRWHGNGATGESGAGWTVVANSTFADAKALRRTGGYNSTSYGGPVIYLDEMNVSPGDTITAYSLITGSGDTVYGAYRWLNAAGVEISNGLMTKVAGGNDLVTSATPQFLRMAGITVPTGAARVAIWNYCLSGSAGFDLVAMWAFKGGITAGPDWPTLEDNYFSARDTEIEGRLATVEINAAPYIGWQSVLGDGEMIGDSTYGAKVLGQYEVMTASTKFNAIDTRVWASNAITAIEWKMFIRSSASAFNPSLETAAASGAIAGGAFPTADGEYRLRLPDMLSAAAGQYVFMFFRAVDDTNVNIKRWLYNAAISPARHGFAIGTSNGWNQTWAGSGPTIGYGQTALKFLAESVSDKLLTDRMGAIEADIAALDPPAAPFFTIPAVVRAVVGTELNLYHDAIFSGATDGLGGLIGHTVSIIGPKGQNKARCFRLTAVSGDIGTHAFTAKAWDAAGNLVTTRAFSIAVVAATAKGSAKNVLMVGDSLTGGGPITSTAQAAFAALGATVPAFVGSQGTAPAKHEGRGGKSFGFYAGAGGTAYRFTVSGVAAVGIGATYTTGGVTYTVTEVNITAGSGTIAATGASAPAASGTLTKASGTGDATVAFSASATEAGNPFWNGSALSIGNYRTVQGIGAVIDAVTVQLGINDVFGETVLTSFAGYVTSAKAIADAFLADNAACKVIIELPTICGNTGDGFAANYGASQSRRIFEANIFGLRAALITALDAGAYNANVLVGSAGLQVDRYYGYARTTTTQAARISASVDQHVNGVHPDTPGYQQNGDAVFAELMAVL